MSDYIEIKDASGTKVKVSVDEVAGQFVQRAKLQVGADGEANDVSAASPLPVVDAAGKTVLEAIATALGATIKVGDGSGALTVDGTVAVSSLPELPAGTKAIGQTDPRGNVAHDGVDAGNPVKVGGRARTALPTAVSQDDRADFVTDKFARQLVASVPLDQRVSAILNRTTTESGQLLAALGEGAYVITNIKVINGSYSVSTKVEILNGETVIDRGYALSMGGGWEMSNPEGLFVTSKNTALKAKCVTNGADVDIFVSGFKIPA